MIVKLIREEVDRMADFLKQHQDWDFIYIDVPDDSIPGAAPTPQDTITATPVPAPPQARMLNAANTVAP